MFVHRDPAHGRYAAPEIVDAASEISARGLPEGPLTLDAIWPAA